MFLVGLEGLWTQVLSICAIHGHTAVHLFLSCPEQGVISAHISTETGKSQAPVLAWHWLQVGKDPCQAGNAHGCWGDTERDGGPRGALRDPAEPCCGLWPGLTSSCRHYINISACFGHWPSAGLAWPLPGYQLSSPVCHSAAGLAWICQCQP